MNNREGLKTELNRVMTMKRDLVQIWVKEQIEADDEVPK